jgi:DNA-directed RNA polymerase subunit L
MDIKFLKKEKNEVEVEVPSLTLVEILRVYLNKDSSVEFAAWKREHYTKVPVLKVITKGKDAKSVLNDAVSSIVKDLDSVASEFKAMK